MNFNVAFLWLYFSSAILANSADASTIIKSQLKLQAGVEHSQLQGASRLGATRHFHNTARAASASQQKPDKENGDKEIKTTSNGLLLLVLCFLCCLALGCCYTLFQGAGSSSAKDDPSSSRYASARSSVAGASSRTPGMVSARLGGTAVAAMAHKKYKAQATDLDRQVVEAPEFRAFCDRMFCRCDLDGNGLLELQELRKPCEKYSYESEAIPGVKISPRHISDQEVEEILEKFDASGDHCLDQDEFYQMMKFFALKKMINLRAIHDKAGSTSVTASAVRQICFQPGIH